MPGELRFDRLTGEWVSIVGHRQARPNLPTTGCPFCVGGLEAPEPYDVKAFTNRWPAYEPGEPVDLAALETAGIRRADAVGDAEVVLYSPNHDASLGSLGWQQIRKVIDLWAERTEALLQRGEIESVLVFESRGAEVGATIHHPHGQLYAFPFEMPTTATEARRTRETGSCVICAELDDERVARERIVADYGTGAAWVPYASAYPYGLILAPTLHVGRIADLLPQDRDQFAKLLEDVLQRYERMWADDPRRSEIFPYLMWIHQAPAHHEGEYHLHVHIAPPQRFPGVARYIAAGEVGAGTLSNPVIPELAAAALRNA